MLHIGLWVLNTLKVNREVGSPWDCRQPCGSHEEINPRMGQPRSEELKRGAVTRGNQIEMEQKLRSHLSSKLFSLAILEMWVNKFPFQFEMTLFGCSIT